MAKESGSGGRAPVGSGGSTVSRTGYNRTYEAYRDLGGGVMELVGNFNRRKDAVTAAVSANKPTSNRRR